MEVVNIAMTSSVMKVRFMGLLFVGLYHAHFITNNLPEEGSDSHRYALIRERRESVGLLPETTGKKHTCS